MRWLMLILPLLILSACQKDVKEARKTSPEAAERA